MGLEAARMEQRRMKIKRHEDAKNFYKAVKKRAESRVSWRKWVQKIFLRAACS
jgi:hypothetical protein